MSMVLAISGYVKSTGIEDMSKPACVLSHISSLIEKSMGGTSGAVSISICVYVSLSNVCIACLLKIYAFFWYDKKILFWEMVVYCSFIICLF